MDGRNKSGHDVKGCCSSEALSTFGLLVLIDEISCEGGAGTVHEQGIVYVHVCGVPLYQGVTNSLFVVGSIRKS